MSRKQAKRYTANEINELINTGRIWLFYNSRGWRNLAEDVRNTFHYECQQCKREGSVGPADEVHHKKPLKAYPYLAYEKNNLEPLCKYHHNLADDKVFCHSSKNIISDERW